MKNKAIFYRIFKLLAVLLGIFLIQKTLPHLNGVLFSILSLVLVILLTIPFALRWATRQFARFQLFSKGGLIKRFIGGIFIRLCGAIILSILCTMSLLFTLAQSGQISWILLLTSVPCFLLVRKWVSGLKRQYVYPLDELKPAFATTWIMVGGLVLLSIIEFSFLGVQNIKNPVFKSNILNEMAVSFELLNTISQKISSYLIKQENNTLNLTGYLVLIIQFPSFLAIFLLFEIVQIPSLELKKVIQPIVNFDKKDTHASGVSLFLTTIFITLFIILFWFQTFAYFENDLAKRPISSKVSEIKEDIENPTKTVYEIFVDLINDEYYKQGTAKEVEPLVLKIKAGYDDSNFRSQYRKAVNIAFKKMEGNVDIFLDGYYSLLSDYARLATMFSGNLENYLQTQLNDALTQNNPMGGIKQIVETENNTRDGFNKERRAIRHELDSLLEDNKIEPNDEAKYSIIATHKIPFLIDIGENNFNLDIPKLRWGVSGGAGLGTAAIAGAISKKVAAGGAFKIFGGLLAKKAAAVATSTAIGATIGSIVPFAGTVVGGIVGGTLGAVAIDWGLLKANEAVNRKDFKKQIIEQIETERIKTLTRFDK